MSRYITYNDRIRIETLHNGLKAPPKLIADTLGYHYTSIYRELKRGQCELLDWEYRTYTGYSAHIAQADYERRASRKGPGLKIGNDHKLASYLEAKILDKHSPKAALDAIHNEGKTFRTTISHTTLYRYIGDGLFLTITNRHLPYGKRKRKYNRVRRVAYKNALKPGIDIRPPEVASRHTFGHWEMDTVMGPAKGKSTCLLVLSERMTRAEIIIKLKQKTASSVEAALKRLQRVCGRHYGTIFKSVTVDNGGEFDGLHDMRKVNVYYCHPYSSWERGTNENINRMIRRHIPKGTPISRYTNADIKRIESWINNYPRQIFGGKTSNMMLNDEILKITGKSLSSFLATKG